MLINPSPVALPATRGRGQTAGRAGNTAQPCQPHTRLAPQPQHSRPTGTRAAPARQIGATTSPSLSHRPAAAWPQQAPGLHHHTQLLTVPQRGPEQHDEGHRLCWAGFSELCRRSCTGFVSRAPPALQMRQLLWRRRLVSAGGA